jgi:hypothetical protein
LNLRPHACWADALLLSHYSTSPNLFLFCFSSSIVLDVLQIIFPTLSRPCSCTFSCWPHSLVLNFVIWQNCHLCSDTVVSFPIAAFAGAIMSSLVCGRAASQPFSGSMWQILSTCYILSTVYFLPFSRFILSKYQDPQMLILALTQQS